MHIRLTKHGRNCLDQQASETLERDKHIKSRTAPGVTIKASSSQRRLPKVGNCFSKTGEFKLSSKSISDLLASYVQHDFKCTEHSYSKNKVLFIYFVSQAPFKHLFKVICICQGKRFL